MGFLSTCCEVVEGGDRCDKLAAETRACTVDILKGGHGAWNQATVIIYKHLSQADAVHTMRSLQVKQSESIRIAHLN